MHTALLATLRIRETCRKKSRMEVGCGGWIPLRFASPRLRLRDALACRSLCDDVAAPFRGCRKSSCRTSVGSGYGSDP